MKKTKQNKVQLSSNAEMIELRDLKSREIKEMFPLNNLKQVIEGKTTGNLKKLKDIDANCCFALITNKDTYEFQAQKPEVLQKKKKKTNNFIHFELFVFVCFWCLCVYVSVICFCLPYFYSMQHKLYFAKSHYKKHTFFLCLLVCLCVF